MVNCYCVYVTRVYLCVGVVGVKNSVVIGAGHSGSAVGEGARAQTPPCLRCQT